MENQRHSSLPRPDSLPPEAEQWLRENPEEERKSLEAAWYVSALAEEESCAFEPDPERVRRMEAAILKATTRQDRPAIHMKRRQVLRWTVFATAVVLLAVTGYFALVPVVIEAPVGKVITHTLPDGSEVELNSASSLRYSRLFAWRSRTVRLEGEAFFDVVHGSHPFQVTTFNSTVTVLGTRFNVRSWPEDPILGTTVVLERGRVELATGRGEQKSVVLKPGQMSRVRGTLPSAPEPTSVGQELAWRSGGLYYVDVPVGSILDEIERRTGVRIHTSPVGLRDERATIVIDRLESVEPVLQALAEMRGWHYESTDQGYVLMRGK